MRLSFARLFITLFVGVAFLLNAGPNYAAGGSASPVTMAHAPVHSGHMHAHNNDAHGKVLSHHPCCPKPVSHAAMCASACCVIIPRRLDVPSSFAVANHVQTPTRAAALRPRIVDPPSRPPQA